MKLNLKLKYSLLVMMVLTAFASLAKDQDEKKKYVEKTFTVTSTTELKVDNKFGKIEINSWEKNEFSVKVEVIGKGRSEERTQRILDAISIDIREGQTEVIFETEIENTKNKNEEGYEVNYTIFMPVENPLEIKNKFGDVSMGDREGNLKLDVSYGSIKVKNVEGMTEVKLSFGSGSLGRLQESDFIVKYSKIEIESATQLDLEQGFSDIELGEVDDLELESKYGKVEIEKAGKIDADVHFSGFEIEELTGSLELECSYLGKFTIERLANTFTLVDIDGKFGSYEIGLEDGMNADIDAEFSFADLKISSDVDATFNYRVKESNKSSYKGKIGTGNPDKVIRIDSGYGNLKLQME